MWHVDFALGDPNLRRMRESSDYFSHLQSTCTVGRTSCLPQKWTAFYFYSVPSSEYLPNYKNSTWFFPNFCQQWHLRVPFSYISLANYFTFHCSEHYIFPKSRKQRSFIFFLVNSWATPATRAEQSKAHFEVSCTLVWVKIDQLHEKECNSWHG